MSIEQACALLASARSALFITGAGVSAASGIPTYRGIGGLYSEKGTDEGLAIEDALSRLGGEPRAVVRRTPLTPPYVRSLIAVSAGGDLRTLRDDEIVQP